MSPTTVGEELLHELQRSTFNYFLEETNPRNGLVADNTRGDSPCSIAAVGLGLASYAVAVERGFISRDDAVERVLTTLRFFHGSQHGEEPDATGYRGFYYHFLDMQSGQRASKSELSTVDSGFLLAGMLTAAGYFERPTPGESEIRSLAHGLYRRAEWDWATDGGDLLTHGWRPERGFLRYRWDGYNEAILLYALALGSPSHPIPPASYDVWLSTYRWMSIYGWELVYAGPLFVHQLSHVWIDFRGIRDAYMREKGIDYFENSRRATLVQREYARRNPRGFRGYHERCWGVTASDGPGDHVRTVDGHARRFWGYRGRGVPWGPDDGTISPWAVVASLPFAPDVVLDTLAYFEEEYPDIRTDYGYKCSFNPTFTGEGAGEQGWISEGHYGLDQGPIILMIENYRTGLMWSLMRGCRYLETGLRRAGFSGGWLL